MAFFDKLENISKNIGDRTSDAIETTKLSSKISTEKAAAKDDIIQIGEYYYQQFAAGNAVAAEVVPFCESAKAHYDAADAAQAEIDRIKAENEAEKATSKQGVCPSCGTAVAPGTKFCASCGAKLPEPAAERLCPNCGAKVTDEMNFCKGCGTKLQ